MRLSLQTTRAMHALGDYNPKQSSSGYRENRGDADETSTTCKAHIQRPILGQKQKRKRERGKEKIKDIQLKLRRKRAGQKTVKKE